MPTLITEALELLSEEDFMLPLLQFPKSGVYRTDKVAGTVEDKLNNYRAFHNLRSGRTSTVTARSSSAPSSTPAASTR